jgi:hypothetical protein
MRDKVLQIDVDANGEGSASLTFPPAKLSGIQLQFDSQPEGITIVITSTCAGITKTLFTRTSNHDLGLVALAEKVLDDDGTPIEDPDVWSEPRLNGLLTVAVTNGSEQEKGVVVHLLVTY